MKFNQRVHELIERKRTITEQINNELQRLKQLGQNQQNNAELFNIPLLPPVADGQEQYDYQQSRLSIHSSPSEFRRFQFTREEIQAFREEHEQRNGDLSKPDDDASSANARVSAVKRPIDMRWSVNLKDPLPKTTANPVYNHQTPIELLQQATTSSNDPSHYR